METYTDEQIKKEVAQTLESPLLRRCSQCANRNESCTKCEELGIPISRYMYAGHCKFYITDEEKLLADAKKAMAEKERQNKKDDRLLTMSFISAEMSIVYLEHFEARVEAEYQRAVKRIEAKYKGSNSRISLEDEEYLKDKKREHKRLKTYIESLHDALKKMDKSLKEARKQFTHFVEPKLNKAFFNKDFTVFRDDEYDDHSEDVFTMCELDLKIFDATYKSMANGQAVMEFVDNLQADKLMEEEDYKRYKFKR